MNKILLTFLGLVGFSAAAMAASTSLTPAGYWEQISDVTHQPQSIMYIWQDDKGVLYGQVVTGFLVNGKPPQQTCVNCPAPYQDHRILGMTIMWGFTSQGDYWGNGHILDPDKGTIYRCNLKLQDEGQTLNVHGYIGIPLIGRTQTWQRLTEQQALLISKVAFQTVLVNS